MSGRPSFQRDAVSFGKLVAISCARCFILIKYPKSIVILPLCAFEESGHFMIELIKRERRGGVVLLDDLNLTRRRHSNDVQGLVAITVLTAGCRQHVSQGFRGIPVGGE